jgi:hypothetical protein
MNYLMFFFNFTPDGHEVANFKKGNKFRKYHNDWQAASSAGFAMYSLFLYIVPVTYFLA